VWYITASLLWVVTCVGVIQNSSAELLMS
jgi:hypothetical protein